MPSWKHNFKAHRVAANMGSIGDNFIYHREQQSFPMAMLPATPTAKHRSMRWLVLQKQYQKFKLKFLVGGGNRGSISVYFGLTFPIVGALVLYQFVTSSTG